MCTAQIGNRNMTRMDVVLSDRHGLHEDALALVLGTLLVALGTVTYAKAVLLVGGMAGLALLMQYTTGVDFWLGFSLINLPFYYLGLKRMGWRFTLRTFVAVTLVSLFSRLTADWIDFSRLEPVYAAVMAGTLGGTGLLMLFRHRTGLGGVNILAMFLQDNWGVRAGYFQLTVDLCILGAAVFVLSPDRIALSAVSAVILNLIIAVNHRPGRYLGIS